MCDHCDSVAIMTDSLDVTIRPATTFDFFFALFPLVCILFLHLDVFFVLRNLVEGVVLFFLV